MACVTNTVRFGFVWIIVGVLLFIFLPWWVAGPIFLIPIVVLGVVGVVLLMTLGKVVKGLQEALGPKETKHDVAAGQAFDCDACTFTLPVAAQVTEMAGHGVSMVKIQPAVAGAMAEHSPMILASNAMSGEEMKQRIDPTFAEFARRAPDAKVSEWGPATEVGATASVRRIDVVKDGKPLRCQATLSGEGESLLVWMVIGPAETFDELNQQVRELAQLVQRKPAIKVDEPVAVSAALDSDHAEKAQEPTK